MRSASETSTPSSSSDEELDKPRRYEILINRLGRFLKKYPDFTDDEEEEGDDDKPWCLCQQGILGGDSIRCDVPGCRIQWYHKACLPYLDLQLAEEFNLWICPNCLMHQLLDLIQEQRSTIAPSDPKVIIDEAVGQQINMAIIDMRLHERGLWIFKDPLKKIAARRQCGRDIKVKSEDQTSQLGQGTSTSTSTGGISRSSASVMSSQDEGPIPGTWGASPSVMARQFKSVDNACTLQESARIWTSEATQIMVTSEETLVIEYKHDEVVPRIEDDISDCPRIRLNCTGPRGRKGTVEVALDLILAFCLDLHYVFLGLHEPSAPHRLLGTIRLKHVNMHVLTSALEFLEGGCLSIALPDSNTPLTTAQKSTLIQYTHLAHSLSIRPLQNAAMHALCTSILRRPQDWSDQCEVTELLKKMTFETNPAWRVLMEGSNCLLPDKNCKVLPCGVEQRDLICMNRGVKALWRSGGPMTFEYADTKDQTMGKDYSDSSSDCCAELEGEDSDDSEGLRESTDDSDCCEEEYGGHDNIVVDDDDMDDGNFAEEDSDDENDSESEYDSDEL